MKFKNTARLIKSSRRKLELSQKDFGKRAGVHIQVISNIERGIAGIPAVRAKKFARVTNVSVELLVETAAKDFYEEYLRKTKRPVR